MCFFGLKIIHRFQLSTHFVFSFSTFSFSPGLGCQIHRWCFHAWWPAAVRSVSHTLEGRGGSCQVRVEWNSLLYRFCNHGKCCLMCVLVKFFTCFYQKGRRCLFFTPIFSRHFYTLRFPAFAFKVTVGWSFPRLPLSIFYFATFWIFKVLQPTKPEGTQLWKGWHWHGVGRISWGNIQSQPSFQWFSCVVFWGARSLFQAMETKNYPPGELAEMYRKPTNTCFLQIILPSIFRWS